MAKIKFTQKAMEGLECPAGRKDTLVFDRDLSGFAVRVTSAGSRVFLIQYGGSKNKHRVVIGKFGVLTVDQARKQASVLLGQGAGGSQPHAARKAAKAAEAVAAVADAYTFATMIDAWAEARAADRRASYLHEAVACVKRNLPQWLDRPAASITFGEGVKGLDEIKATKGTVAANRTLAYARAAYGWAAQRQHVPLNPFRGIERPGREISRDNVLSIDQMAAIWRACDSLEPIRSAFVRTLALTLARVGEVEAMRWSELDNPADPTTWVLPGARAKNGKPHTVHLAEPLRNIIRGLPRRNEYVFSGKGGKNHILGGTHSKEPLTEVLQLAGVRIDNWRLHDFRRAGVTHLAEAGVPPHVADRLLNHITGSISGVAAVYQRAEFLTERRTALDTWAAMVTNAR